MKTLSMAILLGLTYFSTIAQKSPIKFGKISMEEMNMSHYQNDSSASAVILTDYGEAYIHFAPNTKSITFDRHVRIKIFKKDGFSFADAVIPLLKIGLTEEWISNLKASTYNLENGSVVETKMQKESIFKERFNKIIDLQKFTMPNVREGSVIEYSYTLNSDFIFNLPNWEFQKTIPVIHSEYWAFIPEYFVFEKYLQGYLPLSKFEVTTRNLNRFHEEVHHYLMKHVPAFKPEPYLACKEDYLSKINFALSYIKLPQTVGQEIMGSWIKLNERLLEHQWFGEVIAQSSFLEEKVKELIQSTTDPRQKAERIYQYVREDFEWNGFNDIYAYDLKEFVKTKKGSSADINFLLASMLAKAGLTVDMVVLSTRSHGSIREQYPMERQLNYVICSVFIDEKRVLLDATEKLLPLGILPERCLNGKGLIISKTRHGWIEIYPSVKSKTILSSDFTLEESGNIKGIVTLTRDGYDAYNLRKEFKNKGEDQYLKDFFSTKNWTVVRSQFENLDVYAKPVKETHDITIEEYAGLTPDHIYINPFVHNQHLENPFKMEERQYPVDFASTQEIGNLWKIRIPENYTVDELPKSTIFMLPDNGAKFTLNATAQGSLILISSNLQINKSVFLPSEYQNLREFYNQVVAKQTEQIVLKKK
jgi:transglutaminase-like putative cysteine protease